MAILADFGRAASLGFSQGREMAESSNPVGNFIRMMLADWKQKRELGAEYEMKKGLIREEAEVFKAKEDYKQELEESSPIGRYYNQLTTNMQNNPLLGGQGDILIGEDASLPSKQASDSSGGYNPLKQFMIDPTMTEKDYVVKPQKASIRGFPTIINMPEAKPILSVEQDETIRNTANSITLLDRLSRLAPQVETGFIAGRRFNTAFPFNRALMGVSPSSADIDFKSTLTQAKASHSKAESGQNRGFKEIQFLSGAMPDETYPKEKFIDSVNATRERAHLNLRNFLMAADRQGKRLGVEYRQAMADLIEMYPLEQYPFIVNTSIEKQKAPTKALTSEEEELQGMSEEELYALAGRR